MVSFRRFRFFFKKLFFYLALFVLLLLLFEVILSLGGYFYFYVYSNLDNPKIEKDVFRIVFLGESTTEGTGAGTGNAYPSQVEKILQQKYPDKKIRTYNRGLGGLETTTLLRNLDKNMIKYKPQLVALMAGHNERCFSGNGTFIDDTSKSKRIYSRFKLYRLIILIKDFLKLSLKVGDDNDFAYVRSEDHYALVHSPSQVIFNLNEIIRTVHSYGSEIWFTGYLQPDTRKEVNPVLRKIAEENNITYVDDYPEVDFNLWAAGYADIIQKNSPIILLVSKGLAKEDISVVGNYSSEDIKATMSLFSDDGWHPSREGHRIIAEKIAERIINAGIIDRWRPG